MDSIVDNNSLFHGIDEIVDQCNNDLEPTKDKDFGEDVLAKISSFSKKRKLPEAFVMSLFKDRLKGDGSLESLKQYYEENRQSSYSSRTPAWVKIAITRLAKQSSV